MEFTLLEAWSNEKAYNAHLQADPIKNIMKSIRRLVANELEHHRQHQQGNPVRNAVNGYCLVVR
jgi:quinol monooxygenase YgiN